MNTRRFAVALLAAAGALFSAQSLAQVYVGFSAGRSDVDESMVIPGLIDPGGRVDGKDGAFKLFGGYQFNPNFDIQAGYSWFWYGAAVTGQRALNRDDASQLYIQTTLRY